MESNKTGQTNQVRRLLLGRMSTGLAALGVVPAALWGCGGGGEQNLPPSIAEGSISGTSLDGAVIALTSITQTNNLSEPVLGRVVLNQQVLPFRLNVSSDIQQAFTLVDIVGNVARYESKFYDTDMVLHTVESTVTELADGFLIKVSNGVGSASMMLPRSLVPEAATAIVSSASRVMPAAIPIVLWIVIILVLGYLIALLIDRIFLLRCVDGGGTYSSSIELKNKYLGEWRVKGTCTKPTGAVSP